MLTPNEENGIYECISVLPEEWYSDIHVGLWYGVSFDEYDPAIVEDVTGGHWYYIPKQDFLEHFKKIKKEELDKQKTNE